MSERERYAGIVVGGPRDGEMVAADSTPIRIPTPAYPMAHEDVAQSGSSDRWLRVLHDLRGREIPVGAGEAPRVLTYDYEPRENDLGRWVLRETR